MSTSKFDCLGRSLRPIVVRPAEGAYSSMCIENRSIVGADFFDDPDADPEECPYRPQVVSYGIDEDGSPDIGYWGLESYLEEFKDCNLTAYVLSEDMSGFLTTLNLLNIAFIYEGAMQEEVA